MALIGLPVQAHGIYSDLVDEVAQAAATTGLPYRFGAGGVQMFADRRWIDVPGGRIQYRSLPGDSGDTCGGHWCGLIGKFEFIGKLHLTECAVLPPRSASARDGP
jgi:hypothetical protein